jgi:hypothetical protein
LWVYQDDLGAKVLEYAPSPYGKLIGKFKSYQRGHIDKDLLASYGKPKITPKIKVLPAQAIPTPLTKQCKILKRISQRGKFIEFLCSFISRILQQVSFLLRLLQFFLLLLQLLDNYLTISYL